MDSKMNSETTDLFDEVTFQDYEFDSFDDFNDIGAGGLNNNDVSSINVEEYAFQELDLDAKYRSIQTVNPHVFNAFSSPALQSMGPPTLSKGQPSLQANAHRLSTKAPLSVVVKRSAKPVVVPEQPFHVTVTNFTSLHDIDTLISIVEVELSTVLEVSYEFYHEKCRWECVYLCGASRCKFEFNVYKNDCGSFIVEGNRLCGDSFPFSTIYRTIRGKFIEDLNVSPTSVMNFQFIPLPESAVELSSSEIADAVNPILAMASSQVCESRLTAAQILCDLSLQQNMLEHLCQEECVSALVKLVHVEFNYCNQHAVCALANLSSSRSCQEILLKDKILLQQLILLCTNGTYCTAEMRRECARLLANLCSSRSGAVNFMQQLGKEEVGRWLLAVDDLTDERLRLHADRARSTLQSCVV